MKRIAKKKTVAQRIAEGMRELEHAMETGKPLHELFTVRTVEVPEPSAYDAKTVRRTRERLRVSQGIFAKLVGVSVELVEHWEQGVCVPRGTVRRLLDEINRDPDDFARRHIVGEDPTAGRRRKAG
jgi:DNA-binding transcriptional regulator YiaG